VVLPTARYRPSATSFHCLTALRFELLFTIKVSPINVPDAVHTVLRVWTNRAVGDQPDGRKPTSLAVRPSTNVAEALSTSSNGMSIPASNSGTGPMGRTTSTEVSASRPATAPGRQRVRGGNGSGTRVLTCARRPKTLLRTGPLQGAKRSMRCACGRKGLECIGGAAGGIPV
jgi:hypothetical protein